MKTHVSKHFSDGRHDGWKKTVAGREWFLGYGTSAGDEAKAMRLAAGLAAKWQLVRLCGGSELSQSDFEEVKEMVGGRAPRLPATASVTIPHDTLHSIDAAILRPVTPVAILPTADRPACQTL